MYQLPPMVENVFSDFDAELEIGCTSNRVALVV